MDHSGSLATQDSWKKCVSYRGENDPGKSFYVWGLRLAKKTSITNFEILSEKLESILKSIGCKSYVFHLKRDSLTQELYYQGFFIVLVKKRQRTLLKIFERFI